MENKSSRGGWIGDYLATVQSALFLSLIQRLQEIGSGMLFAGFRKHIVDEDKRSSMKIYKSVMHKCLKAETQLPSKDLKTSLVEGEGVFSSFCLTWHELRLLDRIEPLLQFVVAPSTPHRVASVIWHTNEISIAWTGIFQWGYPIKKYRFFKERLHFGLELWVYRFKIAYESQESSVQFKSDWWMRLLPAAFTNL